jgi:hypothetical protein
VPCAYGCGTLLTAETIVAAHVVDGRPDLGWTASCSRCNERAKHADGGGGRPQGGRQGATPAPGNPKSARVSAFFDERKEALMDDTEALRAELGALRAERDAMRAQADPATRVWGASELGSMDHADYMAKREGNAQGASGRLGLPRRHHAI